MAEIRKTDRMSLDIAALQTLRTVFDLGSFSLAADRLGINQSTISYTNDRLRQVFDDPLFVRSGRGVAPTERCAEIVAGAGEILAQYEGITRPRPFDPATAEFKVVFAISHQERVVLMTRIIRYLRRHAPGITVQIIYAHKAGHARLREGKCDILLTPIQHEAGTLYRKLAYRDQYVCIVDRNSPFARNGITLDEYSAARHILITYEGLYRPGYLSWLESMGRQLSVMLDLSSTSEIDRFVDGTDLIATICSNLAARYSGRVAVIPAPFERHLEIYMYWTSRTHQSEGMRWIRDLVIRASRDPGEL
jgi:DNA-binding transcriptional LysR family regulator